MTMRTFPRASPTVQAEPQVSAAHGPGWILAYVIIQFICQLALLSPTFTSVRFIPRMMSFGTSFAFLLLVPGAPLQRHPVRMAAGAIMAILFLCMLHPDGAGVLAVIAQVTFQVAILAPIFWVARLRVGPNDLQRVLLLIWLFSTASAVVGVLQASFPGRFQPSIAFLGAEQGTKSLGVLAVRLASGAWIPRPMGLTDTPGGAASGGFYAVLLGTGVAMARPFQYSRVAAALSIVVGMTCVYLCQVRSAVVMLAVCFTTLIGVSALAGRVSRSAFAFVTVGVLVLVAFYAAFALGGDTVMSRLGTVISDDPGSVYYGARGYYLERAFTRVLPSYPLGAGLGRWGMVNYYFAHGEGMLWAEIQWMAWLYDGGIFLLIAYVGAVLGVLWHSVRVAIRRSNPTLEIWAAVIASYNVGALALTFSYSIFASTSGIEFWLVNAALIQAAASSGLNSREPQRTAALAR